MTRPTRTAIAIIVSLGLAGNPAVWADTAPGNEEPPATSGTSPGTGAAGAGRDLMSEGLRLFMEGLRQEAAPLLDEMREGLEELRPMLSRLVELMGDVRNYEAPEMLPNGDIIIRRKTPKPPAPPAEDGEIEI